MRFIFSVILLLITVSGICQNRNSIWCFGDSAGIDFSDIHNPVTYISVMDGRGSCVSICDSTGLLQFYADTYMPLAQVCVWNVNHDTLFNSNDSIIGDGLYNELQIIPTPANNHEYYLFSTGIRGYYDGIYYSVIDMDLDQGLGAVTVKLGQITNDRIGDCLQAVKHANGRDWWLVSKLSSLNNTRHNRFIIYLITPYGISPEMTFDFNDAADLDFQKITFNPNNTKIMAINLWGYMCEFDFDRCSGIISNPRLIYSEITTAPFNRLFWEGSYSPDGNLFYVSTSRWTGVNESYLIQYDLNSTSIPNSADTIDITYPPIGPGAIRLAPDGKIYYSRAYESSNTNSFPYADSMYNYINMNLSVINNPNGIGTTCDFRPFSFYLGGKRTYYDLPNNPNYNLGPIVGSACDSLLNSVQVFNKSEHLIEVYPTPIQNGNFTILYPLVKSDSELELIDMRGNIIVKYQLPKYSSYKHLDLPTISSGIYLARMINVSGSWSVKFVVE